MAFLAALILLDLTTAFDTVDHDILLQRLKVNFGFTDVALQWLQAYLVGWSQYVRHGDAKSTIVALMCGVRQGHVGLVNSQLYNAMRLISGCVRPMQTLWLPVLANIAPLALRRRSATDKLLCNIEAHPNWPLYAMCLITRKNNL